MNHHLAESLFIFEMIGTSVFAISGALAACERRMDLFGGMVLALITAIGGGTIRDVILGHPAFWTQEPSCIWIILVFTILTFLCGRMLTKFSQWLLIFDALGLAVFSIEGTAKALETTYSPLVAVLLGIMTGVGGGIIRDTLSAEVPLILKKEVYATAALIGSVSYISLRGMNEYGLYIAILITLVIRLLAIRYKLSLPVMPFLSDHR